MRAHLIAPDDLPGVLVKWQSRLRLDDWLLTIRIARGFEFTGDWGRTGEVNWHRAQKRASIKLIDPADYRPEWIPEHGPHDMERDLVHELIHLLFAWTPDADEGSADYYAEEFACESIATALVEAARG